MVFILVSDKHIRPYFRFLFANGSTEAILKYQADLRVNIRLQIARRTILSTDSE